MEDMNNKKKSLSAADAFRKILRDKKVVSAYLEKNGSLRGFDDPGVKLVKPLNFDILEWRKNPEQVLKKVIAENDGFVIPKVISNVAEQVGVEKTAELSGLSVVNVNKSIYLAKAQKELEPYPDPYKTPPAFKMDIRGLFE